MNFCKRFFPLVVLFFYSCTSDISSPERLYVFDVSHLHLDHYQLCTGPCEVTMPPPAGKTHADLLNDYDSLIFLSSLQGIVNQKEPQLYLLHHPSDQFWLETYQEVNQPYGWLHQTGIIVLANFEAVINQFAPEIKALVAWDTAVPATLNVATTIAGVEGWPIVRAGSPLAKRLADRWPVGLSLEGQFEDQVAAYQWAIDQYLAQGKTNAMFLAYVLDGWPAAQYERGLMTRSGVYALERDYIIQQRGFAFDLSPWRDEAMDQVEVFVDILQTARREAGLRLIKVWGFIPWYEKYAAEPGAGGSHHPVEGEWESTWNFSYYAGYLQGGGGDAWGASLANVSVHKFGPKPAQDLSDQTPPSEADLIAQGYLLSNGRVNPDLTFVLFYAGDYDLAHTTLVAWSGWERSTWLDEARGKIPLAWGINPGLEEDIPGIMTYMVTTRTANDFLVGANSGAGYVNPQAISRRYRGQWLTRSGDYYDKYGITIQGFVLNGRGYDLPLDWLRRFARLTSDGIISPDYETPQDQWPLLVEGTPYTAMIRDTLGDSVPTSAQNIHKAYQDNIFNARPPFIAVRSSFQSPTFLHQVYVEIQANDRDNQITTPIGTPLHPNYMLVDPYTFFSLLRIWFEQ